MKNTRFSVRSSVALVAVTLVGLFVFSPVHAAPNGIPPAGNVNANFNSVTTGNFSLSGTINNPSAGGNVTVKDSQGLYVMDDPGLNGFQVLPNGDIYTVINNGQPVKQGNITVNNAGGSIPAAPFKLLNGSSQNVFDVDNNGMLSNPGQTVPTGNGVVSAPVTINDVEGFQVGTGASPVLIRNDGKISGLTDIIGTVLFSGKLSIDYNGTISNLGTGAGGYGGLSYPNWPVVIDDDFQVSNKFQVTKSTGDVTMSGHLKALGGIGGYLTRNSSVSIAAGTNGSVSTPCFAGEQVISCGYVPVNAFSGNWQLNYLYPTATGCSVGAKNMTASALSLAVYAVCFNPNV